MNARDIFLEAIEIQSLADRRAFVEQRCADDTVLLLRVNALLAAHDDPQSFLELPPSQFKSTTPADLAGPKLSDSSSRRGRFLPGSEIAGRYRMVSLLGRGGMGEVYLAEDLRLDQMVALKFLPSALEQDKKRLDYFFNEVRLARRISHPNVCRVYDIGEVNGEHFLSMEYVDGENLKSLLTRIGSLPSHKGIELAHQLCAGLAAAHANGVLHRDIKPANVMIDGKGSAHLMDFGLAVQNEDEKPVYGMSGTPAYMAPEQLLRGETSIQSDLYSLGAVLFEMLSGRAVVQASSLADLRRKHEESRATGSLAELGEQIDPMVASAIRRCLDTDPSGRPLSASELAASLPGGDPLEAAVMSGDTLPAHMIAASGGEGVLTAKSANTHLAIYLVLLALCLPLLHSVSIVRQLGEHALEPTVLRHRAQQIIEQLGAGEHRRSAHGYIDQTAQVNKTKRELDRGEFQALWAMPTRPLEGLEFWYRGSDTDLLVTTSDPLLHSSWNRASLNDPAWTRDGMAGVRLSPSGQLRWFRSIPSAQQIEPRDDTSKPDWQTWFPEEMTGFDLGSLPSAMWRGRPSDASDAYAAWEGVWPGCEIPLRVHAAAFDGRPVFFEVLPSIEAEPIVPHHEQTATRWTYVFVDVPTFILAFINFRRGRGDRRAARRLATYICIMAVVANLLLATHVRGPDEMYLIVMILANVCGLAAFGWIFYMAVETFARKYWPELMISWTRIFHGANLSPRVGHDVMVGSIAAALISLTTLSGRFAYGEYSPVNVQLMNGVPTTLGEIIAQHLELCIIYGYGGLAYLVVVVLVLRSKRMAPVALLAIVAVPLIVGLGAESIAAMAFSGINMIVLLRRGFLANLVCITMYTVHSSILTVHPDDYLFTSGLLALVISIAIPVAGFFISQGRHRSVIVRRSLKPAPVNSRLD